MGALDLFISDIEHAIASGDEERRSRSLRALTELFVEQATKLKDDHVSVFNEVIIRLAREVDAKARSELSGRLADIENAPVGVVKELAYDTDIKVAEPVLERSVRLSEEDLCALAAQRDQSYLLAVSRRSTLSDRVTDVLVKRGDQSVVRAIAQNEGAKFSKGALANLAKKALGDNDLRGVLQKRLDLPDEGIRALAVGDSAKKPNAAPEAKADAVPEVAAAQAPTVQDAPKAKPEPTPEVRRMEVALEKLAASLTGLVEPSDREIAYALERISRTAKGKGIEEVRVANWIKADKIDDALAAIAHNASLPGRTIVQAYETPGYEPLMVAVRAARYSWNVFKLLLTSKDGKGPPADVLKASFESFQQLPVQSAQQLAQLMASGQPSAEPDAATAAA